MQSSQSSFQMALAVSKLNMSDNFNATQGPTELFSYREEPSNVFNDFNPHITGNVE
jgi:hypothetical protein